jgi:hypothetical protein
MAVSRLQHGHRILDVSSNGLGAERREDQEAKSHM